VVPSIVLKREHAHDVGLGQDPLGERVFPRRQLQRSANIHGQIADPLAKAD
jgi:hypothetical protein